MKKSVAPNMIGHGLEKTFINNFWDRGPRVAEFLATLVFFLEK